MRAKALFIFLVAIIFCGCENGETTTRQTTKGGEVITADGIFLTVTELTEFDYKGHKYISCKVRSGISLTHAGHCRCNKK